MRNPSLLSFALAVVLFSTSCTKADVLPNTTPSQVQTPAAYGVSYSDWTSAPQFMWSLDESGPTPFRQATWDAPALTTELIDNGNVLIYARPNKFDVVEPMPVMYTNESTPGESDHFHAELKQGAIQMTHSKFVDGNYVTPGNSSASFRFIILTDVAPPANGRPRTFADLQAMSYEEVITELGIPE